MRRQRWYQSALFFFMLFFSQYGLSDNESSEISQSRELDPAVSDGILETVVVSASHHNVALKDAPVSISVLDGETIRQALPQHPNEVLSDLPGVWISEGSGQEHLTAIRSPVFTGAGACGNFVIAEDDIPVRATGFCNANQLFDTFYEHAEHVEVVRGPNSSRFGGNALFGSINVISPTLDAPEYVSLTSDTAEYNSIAWNLKQQRSQIMGTIIHDNGWRDEQSLRQQKVAAYVYPDESGEEKQDSWFRVLRVKLNNLEQETAGYIFGEESYTTSEKYRNEFPEAYRDARSLRVDAVYESEVSNTLVSLKPYFRLHDMTFLMHFVPWQPEEDNKHRSVGVQSRFSINLSQGLNISYGATAEISRGTLKEYQAEPAPFSQAQFPQGAHYDYSVDNVLFDVFGDLNYSMSDKWSLDTSLRVASTHYDYSNHLDDGYACEDESDSCRFYRPPSKKDQFLSPSFRVGSVYEFSERLFAYASAGSSYRAPQATELYRLQSESQQDLEAVTLQGVDIGMRGAISNIEYDVGVYHMLQHGGVYLDEQRRFVSGTDTSHVGIEYELRYASSGGVSAWLAGTLAEHKYRNDPNLLGVSSILKGNQVDTSPNQMFAIGASYATNSAEVGMSLKKQGAYYLDDTNAHQYPGHLVTDIFAAKSWGAYRVALRVNNVENQQYSERADYAFGDYRYFPAKGRHTVLSFMVML